MLTLTFQGETIAECEGKILAEADAIRDRDAMRRQGWRIDFPGGSWIQWFGAREANAAFTRLGINHDGTMPGKPPAAC